MNKTSSADDYTFEADHEPHTNRLLKPPILRHLAVIKARSVLDIGCGNGAMARDMARICPVVVGMDPSDTGIAAASKVCPTGKFYNLGIYDPPSRMAETDFDAVISTEVIEHLFYPRELIRFSHQKLKPGGTLILSTPYHGWLKNSLISLLGKWDSHHTVSWDGGHIKFWSRATLSNLLREEGFEVVAFHGCGRCTFLWASMIIVARKTSSS